jgi:hypothetical protein
MAPSMNDQPPRPLFPHFCQLPYSLRSLYTATLLLLGLGYLFALANLYFTYAGKAGGNPLMLSYEDIVVAYAGSDKASAIEDALNGPMSPMLPPAEKDALIKWARAGAAPESYASVIAPIIDKRCMACHDGGNPQLSNFFSYDGVKKAAESDRGQSLPALVRDSHIHLFGMTFIFFVVGLMFSHAYLRPVWFKCAIVALPIAMVGMDIGSLYLIKLYHPFAALTIACGAASAACFAFMWLVTLYQMWFFRPPEAMLRRLGGDVPDNAV